VARKSPTEENSVVLMERGDVFSEEKKEIKEFFKGHITSTQTGLRNYE
jgi:hypothetical protein